MDFSVVKNGEIISCDILFTFRDDGNNIDYIVYTDGTKDNMNVDKIYASRYQIKNDECILKPIENDYEWNLIDNMIESKVKKADNI